MLVRIVSVFSVLFFVPMFIQSATFADDHEITQFFSSDEKSKLTVNYAHVNIMYNSIVFDLGDSDRFKSSDNMAVTGTRLKAKRNRLTYLEGARVPFNFIQKGNRLEKMTYLRGLLQDLLDKMPLQGLTKNDQIAYWLNLYNITLIEKITMQPTHSLQETLYSSNSILNEKFITVAGMDLSLNDIQFNIVYKIEKQVNPLLMYGFFQGVIGSPKIRTKAYAANTLYDQLADNAREFINSNRGTYQSRWSQKLDVSWYYEHNQMLFPTFQSDLKKHLTQYITEPYKSKLLGAAQLHPVLTSFNRADLMGGEKQYGLANNVKAYNPDLMDRSAYEMEIVRELRKKYQRMEATVIMEDVSGEKSVEKSTKIESSDNQE